MLDMLFTYLIESVQQFLGKYLILQMKKQKFIHKLSILPKVKLVSSIWNWALLKIHRVLCKHKVNGSKSEQQIIYHCAMHLSVRIQAFGAWFGDIWHG